MKLHRDAHAGGAATVALPRWTGPAERHRRRGETTWHDPVGVSLLRRAQRKRGALSLPQRRSVEQCAQPRSRPGARSKAHEIAQTEFERELIRGSKTTYVAPMVNPQPTSLICSIWLGDVPAAVPRAAATAARGPTSGRLGSRGCARSQRGGGIQGPIPSRCLAHWSPTFGVSPCPSRSNHSRDPRRLNIRKVSGCAPHHIGKIEPRSDQSLPSVRKFLILVWVVGR